MPEGVVHSLLRMVHVITKTACRQHPKGLCGPAKGRLGVRRACISTIYGVETDGNRLESSGMGLIGRRCAASPRSGEYQLIFTPQGPSGPDVATYRDDGKLTLLHVGGHGPYAVCKPALDGRECGLYRMSLPLGIYSERQSGSGGRIVPKTTRVYVLFRICWGPGRLDRTATWLDNHVFRRVGVPHGAGAHYASNTACVSESNSARLPNITCRSGTKHRPLRLVVPVYAIHDMAEHMVELPAQPLEEPPAVLVCIVLFRQTGQPPHQVAPLSLPGLGVVAGAVALFGVVRVHSIRPSLEANAWDSGFLFSCMVFFSPLL